MLDFNTESRTSAKKPQYTKELKISTNIIGSDGEPKEVALGYLALFDNNDILQAIADMDEEDLKVFVTKLKVAVQDAGIRQERAKRTIKFA